MALTAIASLIIFYISGFTCLPSAHFLSDPSLVTYYPKFINDVKNNFANESVVFRSKRLAWNEFKCDDGQIIDVMFVCDGKLDCNDRSDETSKQCGSLECEHKCKYGACINKKQKCNGVFDCFDGSDELHCPLCNVNDFQCDDNVTCISTEYTCNGASDCPDKSDESLEMCKNVPCRGFRCASGGCIGKKKFCNGVADCYDKSDEWYRKTCPFGITPEVEDDSCTFPENPEKGKYTFVSGKTPEKGESVKKNTIIELKCNKNYDIQGPTLAKCINTKWDYTSSCKRRCEHNPSDTVKFECMNQGRKKIPCEKLLKHDTIVVYKCKDRHFFDKNEDFKNATCNNGNWDNPRPVCIAECGQEPAYTLHLMTGKQNVENGTFPWHIAIYQMNNETYEYTDYICGGSIIRSNVVISAAHCFWNYISNELHGSHNFAVVAGKRFRERNNHKDDSTGRVQESMVQLIHIPLQYNGVTRFESNDIALLELETSFTFTQYVLPVCLDFEEKFNNNQVKAQNYGKIAGWGKTETGVASDYLVYLFLPVIDYGVCEPALGTHFKKFVTIDKFCAGYENSHYVCQGDSGGGLVFNTTERDTVRWYIRGIVSNTSPEYIGGEARCRKTYTLFTKVIMHKDFINEYMNKFSKEST